MKTVINFITLTATFLGIAAVPAFGSGFRCTSENPADGYRVLIYNKVYKATRTPKVVVVSESGKGTLDVAKDGAIGKKSDGETILYTIAGNEKIDADQVEVRVAFNENLGDLANGETTSGELILLKNGVEEGNSALVCERYLKP